MKRIISILLAVILLIAMSGTVFADFGEENDTEPVAGGWTYFPEDSWTPDNIPEEAMEAFEKATLYYVGMDFEPVGLMACQLVAGMNYRFLCLGTPVVLNPVSGYYQVTVYENLEGEAVITSVEEIDMPDPENEYGWFLDDYGWWYLSADGTYPVLTWLNYNGTWYYFDSEGYMYTGWLLLNDTWYYLDTTGAMLTGWQYINNGWYFFDESGSMCSNMYIDGIYFLDENGRWDWTI